MSKKKKENPDLTQEFRAQQELHKKQKKNAQNGYQQPYYPNQNGYYNGYQNYQQPYQQQPPYQQAPQQIVPPVEEEVNESVEEDIEYEQEPKRKKHRRKSRVKEYGKAEVDDVEKRYRSQQRRRLIFRGVLIFLNFALLAYLCLSVVDLVFDLRNKSEVTADSYITLCGKSKKQSEEIYKQYLGDNEAVAANDFAIYGDDFYLSSTHIDGSSLSSFSSLFVKNVCSEDPYTAQEGSIDISRLDDGDYIVTRRDASTSSQVPLKYTGNQAVRTTFYTLPNNDGIRKKITVKNNTSSPMLVLSMESVTDLPEHYYDIVYYVEEEKTNLVPSIEGFTSKVIYTTDGYDDVYLTNSSYAFDLTGTSYLSSNFDNDYEGFVKDTLVNNRQTNSFIREIGGYITGANSCIDENTCILNPYYKNDHVGKKAFVINGNDSASNILTHIQTILDNN